MEEVVPEVLSPAADDLNTSLGFPEANRSVTLQVSWGHDCEVNVNECTVLI